MKAFYKYSAYLILGVSALVVLIAIWLGSTSAGLKFVLDRVPHLSTSGEITGSLLSKIEIENVSYKHDGLDISINNLRLDWQPSLLLNKKLAITTVGFASFHGSSISNAKATSSSVTGLELPIDIIVKRFSGKQVEWFQNDQSAVSLEQIELSAEVINSVLEINSLELKKSQDIATLSGEFDLSLANEGELNLDFTHRLSSTIGLSQPLVGSGNVKGTWDSLVVMHESQAPYKLTTSATLSSLLGAEPNWSIRSFLDDFLLATNDGSKASGEISSSGSLGSSTLNALLTVSSNNTQYQVDLDSELDKDQLNLNRLNVKSIGTSSSDDLIEVRGSIVGMSSLLNQTSKASSFSLSGEWQSLEFLSAIANIDAPASKGEFSINGGLDDYQFSIKSQTQVPQFEEVQFALQGHGSLRRVAADSISIKGKELDIAAEAAITEENGTGSIELKTLRGKIFSEPVSAEVIATWSNGLIVVDRLNALAAGTAVNVQGSIGSVSDLTWSLDTKNLALLSNYASGSVAANGKLTGDISSPIVDANLNIKSLVYKDTEIESLRGDLKFGFAPKSKWQGDLKLSNVRVAGEAWLAESTLELSGTLEQHAVTLNSSFDGSQFTAANWRGSYTNSELRFTGAVNNLPAGSASPFLTGLQFRILGDINTQFNGNYQLGKLLTIEGSLASPKLEFQSKSGNEQDFVAENIRVSLVADDIVKLDISAALADGGVLNGKLSVADSIMSDVLADSKLDGELKVDYQDLSSLSALLPPSIQIDGALNAIGSISGFLKSPQVAVNAKLRDAAFSMPEQGILLNDIDLQLASSTANRFHVLGEATAGEGRIKLDGNVDLLGDRKVASRIRIVATDALFIDTPTIKAQGDADLILALQDNNLDLSGSVVADKADLKIGTSMTAVTESPDLILQGIEPKVDARLLSMNLELDLGNQTTISANGLTGRLAGKPTIRLDANGLLSCVGEVQVVDGKFTIVGEKLNIDKGIASYAGGAITNPRLSFEATKTIGNTRAGVSIQGNADSPELSLFSQPEFGDQDILALVFFEKPLDQLSSSDALKLVSIANALRGGDTDSRIDAITNKVAGYLGVEKFDVSLDSENDQRKLSLSSKINSKLDIGYAYNFISSLQALFLRYKINDRWSIQSSVDVESGADIKYRIETD